MIPLIATVVVTAVLGIAAGSSAQKNRLLAKPVYTAVATHKSGALSQLTGTLLAVWEHAVEAADISTTSSDPIQSMVLLAPDGKTLRTWVRKAS